METVDDEIVRRRCASCRTPHAADTPFFVWFNTTHMHFRTHIKDGSRGKAGPVAVGVPRHDGRPRRAGRRGARLPRRARPRRQHDRHVLDRQRSAHELLAGCRHDAVPQREEHQLGGRLPRARRSCAGPGDIPAGRCSTGSSATTTGSRPCSPRPGRPTSPPAARRARADGTTYKVHLDGHNQLPYLTGEADESPRNDFFYVSDDGDLTAVRYDNWKIVFMEQRVRGDHADLGGAVHRAAGPEDLQPAHGSLRARRQDLEHLLGLDAGPRVPAACRPRRSSSR